MGRTNHLGKKSSKFQILKYVTLIEKKEEGKFIKSHIKYCWEMKIKWFNRYNKNEKEKKEIIFAMETKNTLSIALVDRVTRYLLLVKGCTYYMNLVGVHENWLEHHNYQK